MNMNNKKLYIGNLSWGTTDDGLRQAFTQAGTVVSAKVMMDKMNPTRSRGFGFVEMETDEAAQKAVDTLNGTELDGRKIIVNIAKPMEDRRPNAGM